MSRLAAALRVLLGGDMTVTATQAGTRYRFDAPVAAVKEAREALAEHEREERDNVAKT